LRDLMDMGIIGRGLVTNLEDLRTPEVKADERLDHASGNILEASTWRSIVGWVEGNAPDGIDIVMHRPVGALQNLPPNLHRRAAAILIDLLAPNGILFAQIPHTMAGHEDRTEDFLGSQPGVSDVFISGSVPHAIVLKAA
jgi:hypothetical protein